jgi:exonuclease VII large subunit
MSAPQVEASADPLPQIEHWRQASQRWRKLALGSLAGLGIILLLSVVQFVATWMALGKLIETRDEVADLRFSTDRHVINLVDNTQADLGLIQVQARNEIIQGIRQAKQEAKQEVLSEIARFNSETDHAVNRAVKLLDDRHVQFLLGEAERVEIKMQRLQELADRLKRQEREFQKIAHAYQGANFTELVRKDLDRQMLQAKQTLETVQNEMKALEDEARLQRKLMEDQRKKEANPFVKP